MADHRAEDIVTAVVSSLTGLATTGARIYRDRVYELSADELPALLVYMQSDNPRQPSPLAAPRLIDCDLQLVIEAVVKSSAAQVDTTLNQIRYEVSQALHADVTLGLSYVMHTVEGQALPELQQDTDQMVGRLRMDWTVVYRRARGQTAPPAPVASAATIATTGDTIQITFSEPITSGSATLGFTRSTGVVVAGTYSGNTLTLSIPSTTTGASAGTISYNSATGTLAGAGGPVPSFTLAITNNSTLTGTLTLVATVNISSSGTPALAAHTTSGDLVHCDTGNDTLRRLAWNGSTYAQTGSSTALTSFSGNPALCCLDDDTAIYIDQTNRQLKAYVWSGTQYVLTGTPYSVGGSGGIFHLARMSATTFALSDSAGDTLYKFTWNGSTFAQNASYSTGTISSGAICGLTEDSVAFTDYTQDTLKKLRVSGATFVQVGNALTISVGSTDFRALGRMSDAAVSYIDSTLDSLRVYTCDDTNWSQVGSSLSAGIGNYPAMAVPSTGVIVLISSTESSVRRFTWT